MKLYKQELMPESVRFAIGHEDAVNLTRATLDDLRAAAKALGYAVVPFTPTGAMVEAYNVSGTFYPVLPLPKGPPRNLSTEGYKAMIEAAQSE